MESISQATREYVTMMLPLAQLLGDIKGSGHLLDKGNNGKEMGRRLDRRGKS